MKKNTLEKALNYIYLTVLLLAVMIFFILAHLNQNFLQRNGKWFVFNWGNRRMSYPEYSTYPGPQEPSWINIDLAKI